MVDEVLDHALASPGDVVVDCTIGDGGHALALLERVRPGGRLIGLDLDPAQIARAGERMRAAGVGPDECRLRSDSFARLPEVLAVEGLAGVDIVVADLGVSSLQFDDPARGLNYKGVGPLDMRIDRSRDRPTAGDLIASLDVDGLAAILERNADEPHAAVIARLLKREPAVTSHSLERTIRLGLATLMPALSKQAAKDSVRRTFQALRIAVNDELAALEALLAALPACLNPGGRAVIVTFHIGEERRVKSAFLAGRRAGVYADVSQGILRPSRAEILANRRSSSARLHWAVRAEARGH
jgi:16S rRNA (cytosine1402-N4)-methyltransferase